MPTAGRHVVKHFERSEGTQVPARIYAPFEARAPRSRAPELDVLPVPLARPGLAGALAMTGSHSERDSGSRGGGVRGASKRRKSKLTSSLRIGRGSAITSLGTGPPGAMRKRD